MIIACRYPIIDRSSRQHEIPGTRFECSARPRHTRQARGKGLSSQGGLPIGNTLRKSRYHHINSGMRGGICARLAVYAHKSRALPERLHLKQWRTCCSRWDEKQRLVLEGKACNGHGPCCSGAAPGLEAEQLQDGGANLAALSCALATSATAQPGDRSGRTRPILARSIGPRTTPTCGAQLRGLSVEDRLRW